MLMSVFIYLDGDCVYKRYNYVSCVARGASLLKSENESILFCTMTLWLVGFDCPDNAFIGNVSLNVFTRPLYSNWTKVSVNS